MARCGRCGLWAKTPQDHKEQKYAGYCLWYQIRLEPEFEYEKRDCKDFVEKVPQYGADWHFDYKVKRDNLGDAYESAKKSDRRSKIAIGISLAGFALNIIKGFL
tara:strand:+ start:970 stop:1281 length:312 start_codon:yes stop_codon:yes gene_type:complete